MQMLSYRMHQLALLVIIFALSAGVQRRCPDGSLAGKDCQLLIPPNNYMCPTDPVHSRCHNFDGRYYCCAYMKPKCYDKASFCRFTKSLCNDPNYWHLISDECEATCGFCHEQRPFEEILTTIPTSITKTSSVVDDNIANRNDSIKGNISADNPPLESIQQNRGRYMRPTNQDKSRLQENPSDNPFSIFPRTIAKKLPEGHNSTTILSDGTKSSLVSMHSEGAGKTNVSLIQAHDKRPHSEVNIDRSQKAEAENVTMDTSKRDVVDEIFHQLKAASNMKQHFDGFNDHNSWETDNSSTLWNRTQYGRLNSAIAKNPVNISEEKISENITKSIIDNVSEMRSNPISKHDPSHNIQTNSVDQFGTSTVRNSDINSTSHHTINTFFNDLTSDKMSDMSIQKQLPENYKGIKRRARLSAHNQLPSEESDLTRIAFLNVNNAKLQKHKMDDAEELGDISNEFRIKEPSKNNGSAYVTTTGALPPSVTASKDVEARECEDFATNCIERAEFCSNAAFTQFMTQFCAKTCNRCDPLI